MITKRELIPIFLSQKDYLRNALTAWDLIIWISRIFFLIQLEECVILVTAIMITYYLLSAFYGQVKHSSPRFCVRVGLVIPLHSGRNWQRRMSQGNRPNWQGDIQFWLSETSFHASLHSLSTTTLHLFPLIICKTFAFLPSTPLIEGFCFNSSHITWDWKAAFGTNYNW